MNNTDIILSLVIGEIVAVLFCSILKNLGAENNFLYLGTLVLFPILTFAGLWLSWFLGKRFLWIYQAGKFVLVGALATMVDLGVLNLFIFFSGVASGYLYSLFKGVSFVTATCSKYLGDKFWAFENKEKDRMVKEFIQYFIVTLIGLGINVVSASFIVNSLHFDVDARVWANIGGILAAFISAVWNFLCYKFIVFKR